METDRTPLSPDAEQALASARLTVEQALAPYQEPRGHGLTPPYLLALAGEIETLSRVVAALQSRLDEREQELLKREREALERALRAEAQVAALRKFLHGIGHLRWFDEDVAGSGKEPCPNCGCPGDQYDGHCCEDFRTLAVSDGDSDEPAACDARGQTPVGVELPCQLARGHEGPHGYYESGSWFQLRSPIVLDRKETE